MSDAVDIIRLRGDSADNSGYESGSTKIDVSSVVSNKPSTDGEIPQTPAQASATSNAISRNGILERIITTLAAVFVTLTACGSVIVTTLLPKYTYFVEFSFDNWSVVLVLVLLAIVSCALLIRSGALARLSSRRLALGVAAWAVLIGLAWIAIADVWPEWDPQTLINAADMLNNYSSYSIRCDQDGYGAFELCPGGYLDRFPYQIPMMMFDRVIMAIVGTANTYLALELCLIIANAVLLVEIGWYAKLLFDNRVVTNVTLLLGAMFFPLIFYSTFVYGNTFGLVFALAALIAQQRAMLADGWKHALPHMIAGALCLTTAMLFKSTLVIVMLAMIVVRLLMMIHGRRAECVIALVLIGLSYAGMGAATTGLASMCGLRTDHAEKISANIAMGLQHTTSVGPDNYGWYNEYPMSMPRQTYDSEVMDARAKSLIHRTMKKLASDPAYAAELFTKKFASIWFEPTYESQLASNWAKAGWHEAMADRPMNAIQRSAYYGTIHTVTLLFLDGYQSLLLVGAAVSLWRRRKTLSTRQSFIPVFVLGMFVVYMFWESQSQYIMPVYLLMLPIAADGIATMARWANRFAQERGGKLPWSVLHRARPAALGRSERRA